MLTQRYTSPLLPRTQRQKSLHNIDFIMFFAALIAGPLLVTLLTFWVYFIPVVALYLGGIPYLVLGIPSLLLFLPRYGHRPGDVALLAFGVMAAVVGILGGYAALTGASSSAVNGILLLSCFGLFFAPIWAASFAWLYGRWARPHIVQKQD